MLVEIYLIFICVSYGGKGWRYREQDKCRGEVIVIQVIFYVSIYRYSVFKGDGFVLG